MLSSNSPKLNLHGETRDTMVFVLNDFIKDNVCMGIDYIRVIHGRSSDILRLAVRDELSKNRMVESYYLNIWNPGETIVKLKIK